MTGRAIRQEVLTQGRELVDRWRVVEDYLLTQRLAQYGVALCRMLAGSAYIGILLSNFGVRELLFGTASDWVRPYRYHSEQTAWIGMLENVSGPVFTACYLVVIAAGVAFVLGWHTRLSGILLVFGCVQILEMNPLVSDQGDNILRIGVCLLLLTEAGAVWSLDARRAQRRAPGERGFGHLHRLLSHPIATTTRTVVHNAAVIGLAIQLVIVYIAAAMFKIPGTGWRQGTAISYPLRSDAYQVWPLLNDLATRSGIVVWLVTYGAVFLQLYFPALLLNRITRRLALVAIICLHLGIAVLMGLPWFTLAMVAFDGIFISTATYRRLEQAIRRAWSHRWPSRRGRLVQS